MLEQYFIQLLGQNGVPIQYTELAAQVLVVLLTLFTVLLLTIIFRRWGLRLVKNWMLKNSMKWDDLLVQYGVIASLSGFLPVIFFSSAIAMALDHETYTYQVLMLWVRIALIVAVMRTVHALLSFANGLYRHIHKSGSPYKGLTDALVVLTYIIGAVVIGSVLTGKSFFGLISLLGGLTAVTILIFKDTLLNLTASIQLSATDMVKVGDWIEMDAYGADGDVIETSLNTIRVQNWDKTITTIPTYALVSSSFKNWRGMLESGGRRIKRCIFIDVQSVKFCQPELLERLEQIDILYGYLLERTAEMESYNYLKGIDTEASVLNGRRHTNLGLFRAYIKAYLLEHPMVNTEMTFLVRHQPPGPQGIPLEIYVFCKDKVWANYEMVQADIFDHLLAAAREFELNIYQQPSGSDVRSLGEVKGEKDGSLAL